jgi:pimeloyl-ACP methyl ester carboxylesterase
MHGKASAQSSAPSGAATHWRHLHGRPVRSLQLGVRGEGLPELVIVPGLGALGYLHPLLRACAGWTRAHLLDLPGFGNRVTSRCPAGLDAMTQLLCAWLQTVPDDPVMLLGHSTGAQAALRGAVSEPGRVAALCLAGATFPPVARRWGRLLLRVVRTLPSESPGMVPAALPEYLRGRSRVLQVLRTALADEPERRVSRVGCPVLVARGDGDALCDAAWARRLTVLAPQGRQQTFPGGHNFVFQHPHLLSRALRDLAGAGGAVSTARPRDPSPPRRAGRSAG